MKKIYGLLLFIILVLFVCNIDRGNLVWEVKSPCEIFIDTNKNLIFDEQTPVKLSQIHYINKKTDYTKYPILKSLNDEEKFFLEYKSKELSNNLLKNRYVKLKDNDIYIGKKSYTEQMLLSKFVFTDSDETQKTLIEHIKSINLDDYVILNLKSKKYHKLNCEGGKKSAKYKIVKLSDIKGDMKPCKNCILTNIAHTQEFIPVNFKQEEYLSDNIKIFFIDLNKIFKPDNTCSENACKTLKNEIDNAKETIDVAIYGINNQPKILNALIEAKNRGVKIRRVYDYSPKKYYKDNDKLDKILKNFKTDEEYDKQNKSGLMHNKYFIFDNKKVWTGSSNISSTDLSGFNANYAILINSEDIAKKYRDDFEQMYSGIFHKGKKAKGSDFIEIEQNISVKPMFSPQDDIINSQIIPLINSAERYIYMPVFFITHKGIKDALEKANTRGVEIKIINDATNAHTKHSIHNDLRSCGIKVKTENYAGKMHAKVMIIDDKYTVIGSMNFTKSGNSKNDENILIIKSCEIAKYMKTTFMYLWEKIPSKYEGYDAKAESTESIGSCFDGIDNDFDEKIDQNDEGCFLKKN